MPTSATGCNRIALQSLGRHPIYDRVKLPQEVFAVGRYLTQRVERQIPKALAEGKLSGLEGEGKPLASRSGEAQTDMATAVAVRIMAQAGALPEEFQIKKCLETAKAAYRDAQDADVKRAAMGGIADLEQRNNIAVEARRRFMSWSLSTARPSTTRSSSSLFQKYSKSRAGDQCASAQFMPLPASTVSGTARSTAGRLAASMTSRTVSTT
ncbi:MAG: DUF1992 domain-containing protein [Pseudomonadota bacterium]